jgi:hypothetical protein
LIDLKRGACPAGQARRSFRGAMLIQIIVRVLGPHPSRPFRNLGAKSDAKKTHIFQLVTLTSTRNILINMGIQLLGPGRLG